MPKPNEQRKTLSQNGLSDEEIWSAIRYLDPDTHKATTGNAIIAFVAVLSIICLTILFYARGW